MSTVIKVNSISKIYKLYDKPIDRLKESLSLSRKCYHKDYYALNNVSFSIKKGEILGFIGTNGSGKSTLLKILTRIIVPSSGTIEVTGKISALLELGAGFNPEYTGLENIYLNGTMMGYSKDEMNKKLEEIKNFADIGDFINQPVKIYSSGMFARLAFAVAINVEPDILIVDEVLAVGDMRFQFKCMNKMKSMMDNGTTILFVSHDISSIRRFCKKAMWLNNGENLFYGEVNETCDKYADYLKCLDAKNDFQQIESELLPVFVNQSKTGVIAELIALRVKKYEDTELLTVTYGEPLTLEVIYDVYDESIVKPVLGVAIFGVSGVYMCGLNTLLDKKQIPWKIGRNYYTLNYSYGLRVLGGEYYFDVTLRDQTATVNIDYKKCFKKILVKSNYVAEGTFVIPHRWDYRQLL